MASEFSPGNDSSIATTNNNKTTWALYNHLQSQAQQSERVMMGVVDENNFCRKRGSDVSGSSTFR